MAPSTNQQVVVRPMPHRHRPSSPIPIIVTKITVLKVFTVALESQMKMRESPCLYIVGLMKKSYFLRNIRSNVLFRNNHLKY